MALIQPPVDGEFYIDDLNSDFWLREGGVWDYKGRLFRANIVGFWGEGPFLSADRFQLASSKTAVLYTTAFTGAQSAITCDFPTAASCDVIFTDNLSAYLGRGERAIVTGHFSGVSQKAALTVLDGAVIAADSPAWLVLPASADPTMAGLRALISGIPQ